MWTGPFAYGRADVTVVLLNFFSIGITPQDVVDRYHTLIKKSFEEFGISFDVYSRTTSPTHHQKGRQGMFLLPRRNIVRMFFR